MLLTWRESISSHIASEGGREGEPCRRSHSCRCGFFKKFIYSLWFHIIHLDLIHLPPLCIHPLPLQPNLPKNKIKIKRRKVSSWKLQCAAHCREWHRISFCPFIFACKCSLLRVIDLVRGYYLLHHRYWALTGTWIFSYCHVSRRFCSFGPVGYAPSRAPAGHRWGD